jgi:hypothetical protein
MNQGSITYRKKRNRPFRRSNLPRFQILGGHSLFSWEINRPEREVKNSSLSSHEFKNEWNSTSTEVSYTPSQCEQGGIYLLFLDIMFNMVRNVRRTKHSNIITKVTAPTVGTS